MGVVVDVGDEGAAVEVAISIAVGASVEAAVVCVISSHDDSHEVRMMATRTESSAMCCMV